MIKLSPVKILFKQNFGVIHINNAHTEKYILHLISLTHTHSIYSNLEKYIRNVSIMGWQLLRMFQSSHNVCTVHKKKKGKRYEERRGFSHSGSIFFGVCLKSFLLQTA